MERRELWVRRVRLGSVHNLAVRLARIVPVRAPRRGQGNVGKRARHVSPHGHTEGVLGIRGVERGIDGMGHPLQRRRLVVDVGLGQAVFERHEGGRGGTGQRAREERQPGERGEDRGPRRAEAETVAMAGLARAGGR